MLTICSNASGQQDSLLTALNTETDLETKHTLSGKLYWKYLYSDIDFSDSMTSYAIQLADEIDNDSLRCTAFHMKATVKMSKSEYDSSLQYIERIRTIANENNFLNRTASNLALEGLIYYYKGDFNTSLEKNFAALKVQEQLNLPSKQSKTLNNIGISYERLEEYEKAISFYEQSLAIHPDPSDYVKAATYSNIGAVQINQGDLDAAKVSLMKAKSLLSKEIPESLLNDVDTGLARCFQESGEYDKALEITNEILIRAKAAKDFLRISRLLEFIGRLHLQKEEYHKSVEYLEQAVKIHEEKKVGESSLETYTNLRVAYQAVGENEKALVALDSVLKIREIRFNIEKKEITEDLNLRYQTAVKDQELQKVKQGNVRKTYQRNIAISGLLLLLAAAAFIWQRMKSKQLAQQKIDIIQKQKIIDLEKEHKILSISAMLEGEEKERYRIAQDLHDGLGSLLSSVKAHFTIIQSEIKELEKLNVFEKAQEMMDNAVNEVRRISHNLMPPILTTQGLAIALKNLVADYQLTHDMDISIDIQKMEERIASNKEIVFYRICQELLNNINKHAQADKIEISLYGLDENIQLIVEDNGVGFDTIELTSGLGLMSIKSRVEFLKGHLEIDSTKNQGTIISISIPR